MLHPISRYCASFDITSKSRRIFTKWSQSDVILNKNFRWPGVSNVQSLSEFKADSVWQVRDSNNGL
jgi:hypothetical protein